MEYSDRDYLIAQFLQAWINWVEGGAKSRRFRRGDGLCHAFIDWRAERKKLGIQPALVMADELVLDEHLSQLFCNSGLSAVNPFGYLNYSRRRESETQHECGDRLDWVRSTIKELTGE